MTPRTEPRPDKGLQIVEIVPPAKPLIALQELVNSVQDLLGGVNYMMPQGKLKTLYRTRTYEHFKAAMRDARKTLDAYREELRDDNPS